MNLQLDRSGFALAAGLYDREAVERLKTAAGAALQQARAEAKGGAHALRDALGSVAAFTDVAAAALTLAAAVLGEGARPVKATFFDKSAEANWKVAWHQDITVALKERREVPGFGPWSVKAGVPHVEAPLRILERMIALRIHLDDCGADNGPLMVVPGSHRLGKLRPAGRAEVGRRDGFVMTARAGDAWLMRPLLLHRSSPAEMPRHRRVLHIEYAAGELPGGLEWAYQAAPGR